MKKGLDHIYAEEYKLEQLGKAFDRRSNNPNIKHNKDQVI